MAARNSTIRGTEIEYIGYLVVDAKGAMRLSRVMPAMDADERMVRVQLTVPKIVFQTPAMSLNIKFTGPVADNQGHEIKAALSDLVSQGKVRVEVGSGS